MITRRKVICAALGSNALNAKTEPSEINPRMFTFVGGTTGRWSVTAMKKVVGEPLPLVQKLDVIQGAASSSSRNAPWTLRGVTSNLRYTTRAERNLLAAKQSGLDRPEATRAAFIPIRKSRSWWEMSQDERRRIFEETSRHIEIGSKYLPGIARRLHHCRDLSDSEPFDFLTWFDYAPQHAKAFEHLVSELRATEEWKFVEREVDLRLER